MKIFSGNSNKPLAEKICINLNTTLGNLYLHEFPSGEKYCQFKENLRGETVFLIQSIINPANDNLMELLIMIDAAKRAFAKKIVVVIPYFGYQRQDKLDNAGAPIGAKLVMNLLKCAGVDNIITMDLHSAQIQGFTDLPIDVLSFESFLLNIIKEQYPMYSDKLKHEVVIVAPDNGASKKAISFSKKLECSVAFVLKNRLGDDKVEIESFIGKVRDKTVVIIDDLTESVGTLIQAAKICKDNGAKNIICAVTHACFTIIGCTRLQEACYQTKIIDEFIYSNTVGYDWNTEFGYPIQKPSALNEINVSSIFAKSMHSHNL